MADAQLRRVLGLGECLFFAVGVIVGAGIYAILGEAAAFAGNMLWLSFLGASAAAMLTALAYAELVSMFPRSGGEYVYAKAGLGRRLAVVIGVLMTLNGVVSGATISLGFAGYFAQLVAAPQPVAALGVLLVLLGVNAAGIRHSSVANIVMTAVELGGLAFVIVAAAPTLGRVDLLAWPSGGVTGLCTAAALSFFAYIGFEDVVKLAEETREPERTIPRALLLAGAIVGAIYLTIAILAVSAVDPAGLRAGSSPMAAIVEPQYGRAGVVAISVIALFSTANSILSNMIGSSRVLLELGRDGERLRMFARVAPRTGTPVRGLLLVAALMAVFSLIGDLRTVALIGNLFIFATFLLVNLCVIVLRVRRPAAPRPFRIPGSVGGVPVLPVLATAAIAGLLVFCVRGLLVGAAP
jgi:APA family basic amino acid/polyamine antiporter